MHTGNISATQKIQNKIPSPQLHGLHPVPPTPGSLPGRLGLDLADQGLRTLHFGDFMMQDGCPEEAGTIAAIPRHPALRNSHPPGRGPGCLQVVGLHGGHTCDGWVRLRSSKVSGILTSRTSPLPRDKILG